MDGKEKKSLLNRLIKYEANHSLFLYDFNVHYSNNMSEKDFCTCGKKFTSSHLTLARQVLYLR